MQKPPSGQNRESGNRGRCVINRKTELKNCWTTLGSLCKMMALIAIFTWNGICRTIQICIPLHTKALHSNDFKWALFFGGGTKKYPNSNGAAHFVHTHTHKATVEKNYSSEPPPQKSMQLPCQYNWWFGNIVIVTLSTQYWPTRWQRHNLALNKIMLECNYYYRKWIPRLVSVNLFIAKNKNRKKKPWVKNYHYSSSEAW